VSVRQIIPAAAPVRTTVAAEESELVSAPRGAASGGPDTPVMTSELAISNAATADSLKEEVLVSHSAAEFLNRAERALPRRYEERRESETAFLGRLLGELGCQISPGLSPAELSRAFLYDRPLMHNAREVLEVLALPTQRPESMLRQGDWMLRAVPGTGDVGHVAVLASDDLLAQPALATAGVAADSVQPGHYGLVVEAGAYPHSRSQPFARKWLDSRGRVPPHTVLLRPKYSDLGRVPDFLEDEGIPNGAAYLAENVDFDRAVQANQKYGVQLGWRTHFNKILALLGLDPIRAVPVSPQDFAQAVSDWQGRHGLAMDGILGPNTWNALRPLLSAAAAPPPRAAGSAVWARPPGVTVHMDESQLEDWVHKALDGTHAIGSVAEIIEIFHASTAWPAIETALSWGDSALAAGAAAAGETGALVLIGEIATPLGYAATIAITFLELYRAFTTGTRIQKKKGLCYGIMWEALNMPTVYRKFEPWGGDTAEELRKAWDKGVDEGRSAFKTDLMLQNQVKLRLVYEQLTQNRHWFTDPEARVLNLLWEQVRGSDSIGTHMNWGHGIPPGGEYDEKLDADLRVPAPSSPPH
jgi:peptidoglycan hydrolase-like protein with peptidoglycan-binding domain